MKTDSKRTPGTKEYQEIEDRVFTHISMVKSSLAGALPAYYFDLLSILRNRSVQFEDTNARKRFHLREIKAHIEKYGETTRADGFRPLSLVIPIVTLIQAGLLILPEENLRMLIRSRLDNAIEQPDAWVKCLNRDCLSSDSCCEKCPLDVLFPLFELSNL